MPLGRGRVAGRDHHTADGRCAGRGDRQPYRGCKDETPSFAVVSHMENLEIFKRKTDGTPWDRSENNTFGIIFGPVPKRPYSNVRPLESLNTSARGSILNGEAQVLELVADGVGQIPVLGGAGLGAGLENLGSGLVHVIARVGNQAGGNA